MRRSLRVNPATTSVRPGARAYRHPSVSQFCDVVILLSLCCMTLWWVILSACAADTSHLPCAEWERLWPHRLDPAHIPPALARLLASHQGHGLFARFVEEKRIAILQRPLRASGTLVFFPHTGLYRKLEMPFVQELLITPDRVSQRDQQGRVEQLAVAQLPAAQAFVEAFLAVFSGSWETLQRHFQVFFASENSHWQLGFTPNHPTMQKLLACIVLTGERERVDTLSVHETNGDVTADQFSESRLLSPEQWTHYRPFFEWSP